MNVPRKENCGPHPVRFIAARSGRRAEARKAVDHEPNVIIAGPAVNWRALTLPDADRLERGCSASTGEGEWRRRRRDQGRFRQAVPAEIAPDRRLGDADETTIEELQHVGEGGAVLAVGGNEDMGAFMENEEAVEKARLDGDAMAGDIGEAADPRILEAGDHVEHR